MSVAPKFDRSQIKGVSAAKLAEKEKEVTSKIPKTQSSGRVGYHSLAEGKNYFRIYPARPDEDTYIYPKATSWVPFKGEDGKKAKRSIFNSKVHSDLELDVIEEYVRITSVKERQEFPDNKEFNKRMFPLTSWKDGVGAQINWVCYADKYSDTKGTQKVFARLEIYDSVYKEMKKIAEGMESDDDVVSDPFSDPDNGKLLVITKTTKPKKEGTGTTTEYDVQLFYARDYRLTDAELDKWFEQEALSSMLVDVYKRTDFEKALEGLKILDKENKYGTLEDAEFLDIVEKLSDLLPEEGDEEEEENPKPKSQPKATKAIVVEEEEVDLEEIPLDEMNRKQLKEYIALKELPIKVLSSMSDEQIVEIIEEEESALKAKTAKKQTTKVVVEEPADEEEENTPESTTEEGEEGEDEDAAAMLAKYKKNRKA